MKTRQSILLYGAGGHGKVVADMIETGGKYTIAGFVDDHRNGNFYGYPILGTGDDLSSILAKGVKTAIVSIGDAAARMDAERRLRIAGFLIATIIHPSAQIARTAILGEGTVVMPHAVVGPDTHVAAGCIINTAATVDHDCNLEEGAHIAPGAHLAGGVTVGRESHIGIGCSVKEGISIGKRVMVGAGSVVVESLPSDCIAYGVPAKPVRGKSA